MITGGVVSSTPAKTTFVNSQLVRLLPVWSIVIINLSVEMYWNAIVDLPSLTVLDCALNLKRVVLKVHYSTFGAFSCYYT